jgi:AraC-like DNA-binding protein
MPSSAIRTFADPDEYAAQFQQGPVELTISGRGRFTATLCTIGLHHLAMQRLSEELARTSHVDTRTERAFIAFRTEPGPPVIRNGVELGTDSVARLRPGQSYYQHTSGRTAHAGMSLPLDEMDKLCATVAGCDPTPTDDDATVRPSPLAMARLQLLSRAAGALAENTPAVLAQPEAARGLEQAIVGAMLDCLASDERQQDRAATRQHAAIMRRFYRALEESDGQPLYVPELCKAIGASERTLRACCDEHLGMGPKRYLLLRRMHLFRRALRESTPGKTTVTEIATRYGFWQFGRLAVEYKALFGETPSVTLARAVH